MNQIARWDWLPKRTYVFQFLVAIEWAVLFSMYIEAEFDASFYSFSLNLHPRIMHFKPSVQFTESQLPAIFIHQMFPLAHDWCNWSKRVT